MRTTCENCRTVYESPGDLAAASVCPYCEHANRPRAQTGSPGARSAEPEPDPFRTMVLGAATKSRDGMAAGTGAATQVLVAASVRMEVAVLEGGQPTERHTIAGNRATIGRGLCDIRVQDPEASREHCAIEVLDGVPVLKDLQSANGTLLNGRVVVEQVIADGDEIQVGTTRLRFHVKKSG